MRCLDEIWDLIESLSDGFPTLVGKNPGPVKNYIYRIVAFYIIVKCQKLLRCFFRYRFMMIIPFSYGINRRNRRNVLTKL